MQSNDEKIWVEFHGGKLADIFKRHVRALFHPQGVMRQNVLVFDLMSRLEAEGMLQSSDAIREGVHILHDKADVFKKSPYQYCAPHNVNFAFAHDEVLERLEKFVGHSTEMPKEYAERMSSMLSKIRMFGRGSHIQRAFDI